MTSLLLRPLRGLVSVLAGNESDRQIAAGAALGVVLGLVPKDNLIAVALGVLLCSLRVNRTAGLGAAALLALACPWVDPLAHKLGLKLLAFPGMQDWYAWLYEAPLGAWLGFNNTVVLGSLMIGLYVAYPVYLITRTLTAKVRPTATRWILRFKIARLLLGADVTTRLGALT
ncbi:hypothetical protein Mal64_11680 [Pseudobythopirellula maris]|uniref:DUF2062 domain-containing protein n=2 Tax=Pseudobythopirellula maris TaxID=2527991 RepID=A0A5C5ZV20_9BACT|nr:hypothetical protein Mal64_11680 [Pseudobythopirellula maris]